MLLECVVVVLCACLWLSLRGPRRFTRAELEWVEKLALAAPVQGRVVPLPRRGRYLVLSGTLAAGPRGKSPAQEALLRDLYRAGVGSWPVQVSSPSLDLLESVLQKSSPDAASHAGGAGAPGW